MALRVVENDMGDRGLFPGSATTELLRSARCSGFSSKRRIDVLNAFLSDGSRESARAWFVRLQRNGVADVSAYNVMLAHTELREDWLTLLGEMKGAGVPPNNETIAVIAKLMSDSNVSVVRKPGGYAKRKHGRRRHKERK